MCKQIKEFFEQLFKNQKERTERRKESAKTENEKARKQFYEDMERSFLDDEF